MRNLKLVSLLLVAVILVLNVVGCVTKTEPQTGELIYVDIKIVGEDGDEIVNEEKYPTNALNVYDAVMYCLEEQGINYIPNETGTNFVSIGDYVEYDDDENYYFWIYRVNGREVTGEPNEAEIQDGTKITYDFEATKKGA